MQFSNNNRTHRTPHAYPPDTYAGQAVRGNGDPTRRNQPIRARSLRTQQRARPTHPRETRLPHPGTRPKPGDAAVPTGPRTRTGPIIDVPLASTRLPQDIRLRTDETGRPPTGKAAKMLLRKEVIQPHLPVRLPCYDFVPIASPTFDGSLPQGVGPPASGVADFRDVTGGVYKARERIHRSVADLRLLATPTSWGRVADPNPN